MADKVYLRADGSSTIGLGHLVRSIALGHMLKSDFSIHFFCRYAPHNIVQDILNAGFSFSEIREESDFIQILRGTEIVVIDYYDLDGQYQKKIKDLGCKLVCIDDLFEREFYADLIINHAPNVIPEDYKSLIYTQYALGLKYVLLRDPFLKAAKTKKVVSKIETVLVAFGGADPQNLTLKTLQTVVASNIFKEIIVVTGAAFQFLAPLTSYLEKNPIVKHFHAVDESKMLYCMQTADLVIVPASGILLEALSIGCKIISGKYISNQTILFNSLKEKRNFISAEDFGDFNLKQALEKALHGGEIGASPVDGNSGTRLLKVFQTLSLEFKSSIREATTNDTDLIFKWATNNIVRAYSFSKAEIKYQDHVKWFHHKLRSENCFYFIMENENQPVGSIRFDVENNSATISYLLDPAYHGRGLSGVLLKLGIELFIAKKPNIHFIEGTVMLENIASIKAFEKFGFMKQVIDIEKVRFIKFNYYENR